ncbi:hypothetical protein K8089_12085 [Aequorivita sp. F47161]|uniref:Uncharacterized protein n=1 Tax=Aequorivita vitellina TaxID=2874475 RepID=A0A9X1U1J3_9FLAO|nr:hypothetical protein [Aequorivita vitellina]MCG2419764.1 hypothetical protein [Aequorivita vitellina]
MAKQKGILKLKGTIGDFTFYKTEDGYMAREKGGIDKDRILNDPAFKRTRENGMEFGTAGKSGQLIRKAERLLLKQASDKRVTSRLVQVLMAIIKTDPLNKRGSRTVQDGDMSLLKGFDFNQKGKLDTVYFSGYSSVFDRAAGTLDVAIEEFVPNETIDAPRGTTHIQLVGGICALDFQGRKFEEGHEFSPIIPWDTTTQAALTLSTTITAGSTLPVLQVVGVNFFQEVNGEMYPLRNGAFNALAVVEVDQL